MHTHAYAAKNATSKMEPYEFDRREPTAHDVEFKVLYCGVCYSDIHTIHSDWGPTRYPSVPGHEIVGVVTRVGDSVTKFKVGDKVGVGCLVNSCGKCASCKEGLQQYCEQGMTGTYNAVDPIDGEVTKGGYSTYQVAQEDFVMAIPDELDLAHAAPLLCAGITMYSPLRHWNVGPGMKVGIIGLGGLGHMGVKYAHALGAEVYLVTTSPEKAEKAKEYGADGAVVSTDEANMEKFSSYFDVMINTIPVGHDVQPYINLLNRDGVVILVGPISPMEGFHGGSLIGKRRSIAGSVIGGIPETVEMLNFSAEHGIVPDIEIIPIKQINDAHMKMMNKSMSHRYVIDLEASFK
jgi:uncharacterized zinc-type alcohol dehydrogenase-like protein